MVPYILMIQNVLPHVPRKLLKIQRTKNVKVVRLNVEHVRKKRNVKVVKKDIFYKPKNVKLLVMMDLGQTNPQILANPVQIVKLVLKMLLIVFLV